MGLSFGRRSSRRKVRFGGPSGPRKQEGTGTGPERPEPSMGVTPIEGRRAGGTCVNGVI